MNGARVLVTGSSGFIGSHLVEALAERGHSVAGLDHSIPPRELPLDGFHQVDLRDREGVMRAVESVAPTTLLHLGARADLDEKNDLSGYDANIGGVRNLLDAMAAVGTVTRAICTSTQLVCRVGYVPRDDHDYCPTTLYGRSKVRTEEIWREADGAGTEWCITRPTTIWGPGMNPHYLTFFRMVRDGRYFHVGKGDWKKSYGYIGNTVHQYLKLLGAPREEIQGRVFYLADYEPLSLGEWAEKFRIALGGPPIRRIPLALARTGAAVGDLANAVGMRRFPLNSFRLKNVITEYQFDLSATRRVCGALPFTLDDGVGETARWIRDALDG